VAAADNQTHLLETYGATVEDVVHLLRQAPEAALSLNDMADIAALSPSHFNRVFRSIVGIPPVAFQAALRLDLAKRLLLTTPLSVTEICFAVGYDSPGTFTARFSRSVGIPPRSVRDVARAGRGPDRVVSPRPTRPPNGYGITGLIQGPDSFSGLIVAGLFPTPVPQSRPGACTILSRPGPYRFPAVPDGRWYLLAAGLPNPATSTEHLMLPSDVLVAVGKGPLVVRRGRVTGDLDVRLRPPHLFDPPVLTALPPLLPPPDLNS
jgi:AraC family transcriptional regulator